MIKVGLTTWTDHPDLVDGKKQKLTLPEYTDFFSVVEIDSSFYAIPKVEWVQKWAAEVPRDFKFIVKANFEMTKTPQRGKDPLNAEQRQQLFQTFKTAIQPLVESGQLLTILFQFPPSFLCNYENIQYLRLVRRELVDYPLAIEFRNATWQAPEIGQDTDNFLKSLHITEVVVDEPHATLNGMKINPVVTNPALVYVRLHGQNEREWAKGTRERYRYRYSQPELEKLAKLILGLEKRAAKVVVIFNNNTGKDAAANAQQLEEILKLKKPKRIAKQLNLF
ncbi:DUF72 domain-containing protein [Fructilactobacillus vespulae]|uniref:DUF72 domain-containing protein n=1 Tax=Fructilactobacillus vespulae TaxID=1249630 RepID=UPI0039B4CA80